VYVLLNFWAVHLAMKKAFKFSYTETSFVHQTSLNYHGAWQQIYGIYDDEDDNERNLDKKIKVFLRMVSPNNKCDAEANNHELGQQALCFWESEKKSTQLRAELKLDQDDL